MKELLDIAFDPKRCREELERFRTLLESKPVLSERLDLQPLFKSSPH